MKNWQQQLEEIEKSAEKEFEQLLSLGPTYFKEGELLEMRGSCQAQLKLFNKLHKIIILLGASSPMWILMGLFFGLIQMQGLALYLTALFPISVLLCVTGAVWMKREFNSKGQLEYIYQLLTEELYKRQQEKHSRWN